jgi:hypothetical protein
MTPMLTAAGYLQTLEKLAGMEARLTALRQRSDLVPTHKAEVERSYLEMIGQYRREIKLYEAAHSDAEAENTV